MSILLVNSVVNTVQRDGYWHGTPAIVVSLLANHQEDDGVPFVDHLYANPYDYPTYPLPNKEIATSRMLNGCDIESYARIGEATLWTLLKSRTGTHIVITGSEPCQYGLARLTELLHGTGRKTQVETRGRAVTNLPENVWVTLKPAPVREGELEVIPEALERANEIIASIYYASDVDRLDRMIHSGSTKAQSMPVFLRPHGTDRRVFSICVEAASARKWRVGSSKRIMEEVG